MYYKLEEKHISEGALYCTISHHRKTQDHPYWPWAMCSALIDLRGTILWFVRKRPSKMHKQWKEPQAEYIVLTHPQGSVFLPFRQIYWRAKDKSTVTHSLFLVRRSLNIGSTWKSDCKENLAAFLQGPKSTVLYTHTCAKLWIRTPLSHWFACHHAFGRGYDSMSVSAVSSVHIHTTSIRDKASHPRN